MPHCLPQITDTGFSDLLSMLSIRDTAPGSLSLGEAHSTALQEFHPPPKTAGPPPPALHQSTSPLVLPQHLDPRSDTTNY